MDTISTNPTPAPARAGKWGIGLVIVAILVVGALAIGGWMASTQKKLVGLDEARKSQWSQVETVLQRRFDLIPNLVATVKGYAEHEKEVLEKVTALRSQWGAAKTIDEKAKAAGELEGVLSRLMVISENYPDLKANEQFRDLQVQLEGTENRISVERGRYNDSVQAYNTAVRTFPASLVAGTMGFQQSDAYFKSAAGADVAPKVDFK